MYYLIFFSAEGEGNAFDDKSGSVIRLNNSTILYLREVSKVLALVCIFRDENFTKPGESSQMTIVKTFTFLA